MRRTIGLIVVGLLLAGCTSKSLPKTAPVKGKVLDAKGNPLTAGSIRFEPKQGGADMTVSSPIGSDGGVDLKTFRNKDQQNGAPPGDYTVIVQRAISEGNQAPEPVTLPDPITVPPEGKSDLTLKLPAGAR